MDHHIAIGQVKVVGLGTMATHAIESRSKASSEQNEQGEREEARGSKHAMINTR